MYCLLTRNRGFTLIEAIVVIVITGIIAGMVAVFIRTPVDGYLDAERRAGLTDIADTAVRRMARDLRLALPNSVRTSADGSGLCIEFIPTKIGARYRAVVDGTTGNGDPLDFTTVDDRFEMLWLNSTLPADSRIAAGDVVVVFNDGSSSGNAYTRHQRHSGGRGGRAWRNPKHHRDQLCHSWSGSALRPQAIAERIAGRPIPGDPCRFARSLFPM